jgi:hypothetical protein
MGWILASASRLRISKSQAATLEKVLLTTHADGGRCDGRWTSSLCDQRDIFLWISVRVKERSCCPLSFCPSSRLSGSNSRPTSAGSPSEISPLRDSFIGDVYPCSLCAPMLSSTRYRSGQPFFFANPFHYDIMELVLDKIVVSYLKIPRSIFLIFYGTLTIMLQISEFLSAKSGGRAQWRVSTTLGLGQRSVNIFELPPS